MWNTTTIHIAAALALSLLVTSAAQANTVDVVVDGFAANNTLQFWAAGHSGSEVVAGVYLLDKTAGTGVGNTWSNGLIPAFCIELEEPAPHSTYTYQVTMPDDVHNNYLDQTVGTTKANYLRELWARYYDNGWTNPTSITPQQHVAAEAFAAAIWEILYEDLPASPLQWDVTVDGTLGAGGFRAENLDAETANKWLWNLTGVGPKADLRAFVHDGQQNYLVAVPEPATIVLLGLGGIAGLAGRRRHRAQMLAAAGIGSGA